eukprot:m.54025 g.54025  ORF g.54025 m.54025 type:complete len:1037 (-) comp15472_c0_seq8:272-3382(-)
MDIPKARRCVHKNHAKFHPNRLQTLNEVAEFTKVSSDEQKRLGDVVQADRFVAHIGKIHISECTEKQTGIVALTIQDIIIQFLKSIDGFAQECGPSDSDPCEKLRHHAHGDCSTSAQATPFYIGTGLCIGMLDCCYCRSIFLSTCKKSGQSSIEPLLRSAQRHPSSSVQGAALQCLVAWLRYHETSTLIRQWLMDQSSELMLSLMQSLAHPAIPVATAAGTVCVQLINNDWPFTDSCFEVVAGNLHPTASIDVQRSTLTFVESIVSTYFSKLPNMPQSQSGDADDSTQSIPHGRFRRPQLWFLPMVHCAVQHGLFSHDKLVIHHCISIVSTLAAQSLQSDKGSSGWLTEMFSDQTGTQSEGAPDDNLFRNESVCVFSFMKRLLCTHSQHQIPTLLHLAVALLDVVAMPDVWDAQLWAIIALPLTSPSHRHPHASGLIEGTPCDTFLSVYEMFGREFDADVRVHRKAQLAALDVILGATHARQSNRTARVASLLHTFVEDHVDELQHDDVALRKVLRVFQEILRHIDTDTRQSSVQHHSKVVTDVILTFTRLFCPPIETCTPSEDSRSPLAQMDCTHPSSEHATTSPPILLTAVSAVFVQRGPSANENGMHPFQSTTAIHPTGAVNTSARCSMRPSVVLQSLAALGNLWTVMTPFLGTASTFQTHVDALCTYVMQACCDENWDIRESAIDCMQRILPVHSAATDVSVTVVEAVSSAANATVRTQLYDLNARYDLTRGVWRQHADASPAVRTAVLRFLHALLRFDPRLFLSTVQDTHSSADPAPLDVGPMAPSEAILSVLLCGLRDADLDVRRAALALCTALLALWHAPARNASTVSGCPLSRSCGEDMYNTSPDTPGYHQVLQLLPRMMADEDWEIKVAVVDLVAAVGLGVPVERNADAPLPWCRPCAAVLGVAHTLARAVADHDRMVQQRACAVLEQWARTNGTAPGCTMDIDPGPSLLLDENPEKQLCPLVQQARDVRVQLRAGDNADDPANIEDWNDVFEPDWDHVPPGLDDESEDLAFALETGLHLSVTRDCY